MTNKNKRMRLDEPSASSASSPPVDLTQNGNGLESPAAYASTVDHGVPYQMMNPASASHGERKSSEPPLHVPVPLALLRGTSTVSNDIPKLATIESMGSSLGSPRPAGEPSPAAAFAAPPAAAAVCEGQASVVIPTLPSGVPLPPNLFQISSGHAEGGVPRVQAPPALVRHVSNPSLGTHVAIALPSDLREFALEELAASTELQEKAIRGVKNALNSPMSGTEALSSQKLLASLPEDPEDYLWDFLDASQDLVEAEKEQQR